MRREAHHAQGKSYAARGPAPTKQVGDPWYDQSAGELGLGAARNHTRLRPLGQHAEESLSRFGA